MELVRIKSVEPLERFTVRLGFTNGTKRDVDLEPFLRGGVFEILRQNQTAFRAVKVDERMGTIVWENGADIDPDVLYYNLKPAAWAENLSDLRAAQKEEADAPTIGLPKIEKEFGIK